MARSYGNIVTAIWKKTRTNDFLRLSCEAQRVYLMLATQSEISAVGSLRLVIHRWSTLAGDSTVEGVKAALAELADKNYIVIDYDDQLVLVRSFVKWDKGYRNAKRRPVILAAAAEIDSPMIRSALRVEFERLALPTEMFDADEHVEPVEDPLVASPDDEQETLFAQVDTASDVTSRFDRVVVTKVGTTEPQSSNHIPHSVPAARADAHAGADGPTVNQRAQRLARVFTDVVKLSNFPAVMGVVKKAMAAGEYPDDRIEAALARMAADRRTVSVESLRIELEGLPARRARIEPGTSTTDQRVAAVQPLKARRAEQRNAAAFTGTAA